MMKTLKNKIMITLLVTIILFSINLMISNLFQKIDSNKQITVHRDQSSLKVREHNYDQEIVINELKADK